jgi:crotonobetainyl-CoA:carnitine CoA-transferase CaiB-like acyl-CoA transferase
MATPKGREIIYKVAEKTDLVMCSYRKGAAEKLGVDYDSLRKINPRLVYLHSPAFGIDGPCAYQPAFAPTITAAVGGMQYLRGPNGVPVLGPEVGVQQIKELLEGRRAGNAWTGGGNADGVAALGVATGLLLGLVARERTGKAYRLMTTMLCSNAYCLSEHFVDYQGKPPGPMPDVEMYGFSPLYRLYQAKDAWLFLAAPQEKEWHRLCQALHQATGGHLHLAANEHFRTPEGRRQHAEELAEALAAVLRTKTADEWEALFSKSDIACVKVGTTPTTKFIISDPVMTENGYVDLVEHPTFGEYPRPSPIVTLSHTPGISQAGCTVGQHTALILRELGYGEAETKQMEEQGIVATSRKEAPVAGRN